jgi:biopolymer transport protein ExbD
MAGGIRHSSGGDDEPMVELNLIPLIDIALTLLIILMVTSAFIRQPGVSLKLPETSTREGKPQTAKDTVVAVARNGRLYLDGAPVADAHLKARLVAHTRANPTGRVLIKGDREVPYARVMRVMDAVRQAGITRVVLPTDPVRQGAPRRSGVR